jgi:nitrate reductase NapE
MLTNLSLIKNLESIMNQPTSPEQQRKYERNTFIFLTVFLAPILSVIIVACFGFAIWFSQLAFLGPPSA